MVAAARHHRDTADASYAQQLEVREYRRGGPAQESSTLPSTRTSLLELASSENFALLSKQQSQPEKMASDREEVKREEKGVRADNEKHELDIVEEGRRTENMVMEEPKTDGEQKEPVGGNVGYLVGNGENGHKKMPEEQAVMGVQVQQQQRQPLLSSSPRPPQAPPRPPPQRPPQQPQIQG